MYGWNLSHLRRAKSAQDTDLSNLATIYRKAKQKPSFTEVHEADILQEVRRIDASHFEGRLNDLPKIDTATYTNEELGVELLQAGISNKNIDDMLATLLPAERRCSWDRPNPKTVRPSH